MYGGCSGVFGDWPSFAAPSADVPRLLTFEASSFGDKIGLLAVGELCKPSSPLIWWRFPLAGSFHGARVDIHGDNLRTRGGVGRSEVLVVSLVGRLVRLES